MMDSHSELNKIAATLFPELRREISTAQDDIRSAEHRIKRIPDSVLVNGAKDALDQCLSHLDSANSATVSALKSVHSQYPHSPEL
jgi:hypothetical protein